VHLHCKEHNAAVHAPRKNNVNREKMKSRHTRTHTHRRWEIKAEVGDGFETTAHGANCTANKKIGVMVVLSFAFPVYEG
jgi:hypothetical protein